MADVPVPAGPSGDPRPARAPGAPARLADRRGGPSNLAGVDYQIQVVVHHALQWIDAARHVSPSNRLIRSEPRVLIRNVDGAAPPDQKNGPVAQDRQLGYDFGLCDSARPDEYVEIKRTPTTADVTEFVASLNHLTESGARFRLVAEARTAPFRLLERLIRLAAEAADQAELERHVSATGDRELSELFEAAGPEAHAALGAAHPPLPLDEHTLEVTNLSLARTMAPGGRGQALVDRLARIFLDAGRTRRNWRLDALIDELVEADVLMLGHTILPTDPAPVAVAALVVLETSTVPVPTEILAAGMGTSVEAVDDVLSDLVAAGKVHRVDDGYICPTPAEQRIPVEFGADLTAAVLHRMNLVARPAGAAAAHLTPIAHALATRLGDRAPEVVAKVFVSFDKASKSWGDLWATYDLAQMSTDALMRLLLRGDLDPDAKKEWGKDRAQTYICGQAWVYQRVGDLAQATAFMDRADQISRANHDPENHAFTLKCRGRLFRMQAEELPPSPERDDLLARSTQLLRESHDAFDELLKGDPRFFEDRGECVALLARTHATDGDLAEADHEVRRARELLHTRPGSKAMADVILLEVELAMLHAADAGAAVDAAERAIHVEHLETLALDNTSARGQRPDRSASEIAARAHFVLGRLQQQADPASAVTHFEQAADMYDKLGYPQQRDRALWQACLTRGEPIPAGLRSALDDAGASDGARLLALEQHLQLSTATNPRGKIAVPAPRPDDSYWQGIVTSAVAAHTASTPSWTESHIA